MAPAPVLADDVVAAFARDGVACLRSVLDAGEVAVAVDAIAAVLATPGPLAQVASGPDDPGAFVEDFCRWQDIPEIEQLARYSRVPALAAALMATPQVRFYHDHVLVKEGRTRQHTPWHQDQPYYNVDGRGVSAWIAVDPVPEDGCLELVAGSHRGPWLMPRTFLHRQARWFPEGSLAELPEIEADRDAFDIRRFDLQPGDAIFFDFLAVHGAPGFRYPGRRRILSLRYLSADARHAPRGWRTSPPFDDLETELPAGAAMDHPLFPVVWPALGGHGVRGPESAGRFVPSQEPGSRWLGLYGAGGLGARSPGSSDGCGYLSRSWRCDRIGSARFISAKAVGQSAGPYPAPRSQ